MHFILKCPTNGYNAAAGLKKGSTMNCFALLIHLAITAALPAPGRGQIPAFPTKTTSWELTDALSELRDPRATPLQQQVARLRLEKLGAPAVPALRRIAAGDPSREVRAQAEAALASINDLPVIPATAERLESTFPFVNITSPQDAAEQLRSLLAEARSSLVEEALQRNIELLERGTPADRADAANRLACIRPFAAPALPALVRALNDPDADVRNAAANAICADGAAAPVEQFITMLDDRDATLRVGAMRGLLRFAPHDSRFTQVMHPTRTHESLLANLRSPYPERRIEAAAYLAENRIIPPLVAAALLKAVRSGDFVARGGLVLGIERAWADGGEVEAVLKKIQDDDTDLTNRAFASAARRAITSIKPD
jgi:HEAT repeat protein